MPLDLKSKIKNQQQFFIIPNSIKSFNSLFIIFLAIVFFLSFIFFDFQFFLLLQF